MRTWLVEKRKNIDDAYERQRIIQSKDIAQLQRAAEGVPVLSEQQISSESINSTEETLQKLADAVVKKAQFLI